MVGTCSTRERYALYVRICIYYIHTFTVFSLGLSEKTSGGLTVARHRHITKILYNTL
jgi:hypothetical protein